VAYSFDGNNKTNWEEGDRMAAGGKLEPLKASEFEAFRLAVPENERMQFLRTPAAYVEEVLKRDGRTYTEIHVVHLRHPQAADPRLLHIEGCHWI
jgi:hypothetical protein